MKVLLISQSSSQVNQLNREKIDQIKIRFCEADKVEFKRVRTD